MYIHHLGGESIPYNLLQFYVDDGESVEDITQYIRRSTAPRLEYVAYRRNPRIRSGRLCEGDAPPEVAIIYAGQGGEQSLFYASYNWTGTIPPATPGVPPVAAFSASPTSGTAPLTVQFTDSSTGGVREWSWTFGDSGTSTLQHPTHTYAAPGTYTVSLTASNAFGSDTETKTDYITVNVPLHRLRISLGTAFGSRIAHRPVHRYLDECANILGWTFGDGGTSTLQNPSHTYAAAGTYTVTLTAANAGGSDTETKVRLYYRYGADTAPDRRFFRERDDRNRTARSPVHRCLDK